MTGPDSKARTVPPARWENWFAALFLCAAVAWFGWAVTRAWDNGNLPGCEFRQAQTAVSAYWIQKDRDFSLAYPTPVLGKPWSIPMEFPLYQWTVVAVSDLTSTPLVQSARAVSLGCFLAALPALWILLRRFGLPRARRTLLLALVLTCPLLVFYARSFLIETMALMWALWFVAAFGEAMHTRGFGWLALANLAGAAAGTVKVTTFILYLLPSAGWGAWLLWRAWRGRIEDWSTMASVLARGLGCVVFPFVATVAWTKYADSVKALNPNGAFLASDSMTGFNFGLGLFDVRFSGDAWRAMFGFWSQGILAAPVVAVSAIAALFAGGRWRWPALGSIGLFFLAQFIFPLLYAWHEYYFVANAALLVLAAGFSICGLLESRHLRWLGMFAAVALLGGQSRMFVQTYRPNLSYVSYGGTGLTDLIHHLIDPQEMLVIAGEDWDSTTPFYAKRKALMIRRSLEKDWDYLQRAFEGLKDQPVGALLLSGEQRSNTELLARAARELGIDPRPVLEHGRTTLYLHRDLVADYATDPVRNAAYEGIVWHPRPAPLQPKRALAAAEFATTDLRGRERLLFTRMMPQPYKFFSQFGVGRVPRDSGRVLTAHPDTRLWFHLPADARSIELTFGITEGAYADRKNATDGAEVRLSEIDPDGNPRTIFSRIMNPLHDPADRGELRAHIDLAPGPERDLLLETLRGPQAKGAYDWVFLGDFEVR